MLSACGTQINTLRKAATGSTATSGVPAILNSLTIQDSSPTKNTPLTLSWGLVIGEYTQYCILENTQDVNLCVWKSGALPTSYLDSAPDGALTLSAYLKNAYGTSVVVDSNLVTIDRTPPQLASATVGNSDPTNSTSFSLSYGAITNAPYSSYCINENNTSVAACSWTNGVLPAAFTVTATNGVKVLSIWLRDLAGNISNRVQTGAITYDGSTPVVAFSTPSAGSYINAGNVASYTVTGSCTESGRNVVISGSASATVMCTAGAWTANLNFTAAAQGTVTIYADHSNTAGTSAVQISRSFTKDTGIPSLAISTPAAASYVNASNVSSFPVTGTCSENGRNVVITGSASATVTCTAGNWSASLDFTAAGAGAVSISVDHGDAAGNAAATATRGFTKDVTLPTVAISTPAALTTINGGNVSSFTVTGSCSENGRNVVISGAATGTVACAGLAWSINLDFTSASDGTVTIYADHSDIAGNPAAQDTRNFTKTTGVPGLAITNPLAGSFVNAGNVTAFAVSGTCSENGQNVVITGDASTTVVCAAGAWSANLNFTAAAQGAVTIYADHQSAAMNPAAQVSRSFTKDTVAPTVLVTSPAANSIINIASQNSYTVSGTCSENTRTISITGDATGSATCTGLAWSVALNFGSAAAGTVTITAAHTDAAGNAATTDSRSFVKNVTVPTVVITSPAAGTYANITNASAFPVSGTCSDNGQNVSISGAGTGTVVCAALAWSTTVDVSTALDGSFTLYADHTSAAGNPATQDSRNFNKDTVAPSVAITGPTAGAYVAAADMLSYTVSGTCTENGRNVAITGSASGTTVCASLAWSINLDFTAAAQGNVTINADHTDIAGNPATQDSRTFLKDSNGPTIAVTSPNGGEYWAGGSSHAITWTASDTNGVAVNSVVITYSTNSGSTWNALASGEANDGTYTWNPLPSIDFSTVRIRVAATDSAGNSSNDSSNADFTIDSTPPTLAGVTILNATPTPSRGYLLSYTTLSESISQYCIKENDTSVTGCVWNTASALPDSYTVTATMNAKVLTVWVRDLAGNQQVTGRDSNSVTYSNVLAISPTSSTLTQTLSIEYFEGRRGGNVSILLDDGRLFIAGGCHLINGQWYAITKTYDFTLDTWTSHPNMSRPKCHAAYLKLADGKILVAGGLTSSSTSTNSVEIFDPTTNTWSTTYPMGTSRAYATATLLTSGKVLVTGGYVNTNSAANTHSTTEIYDPATQVWITGPAMNSKRQNHSAVKLSNGTVLIAGGSTAPTTATNTSDVFTPSGNQGSIAAGPTMAVSRADFSLIRLDPAESPTGAESVLAIAGYNGNATYRSNVDLYNGTIFQGNYTGTEMAYFTVRYNVSGNSWFHSRRSACSRNLKHDSRR